MTPSPRSFPAVIRVKSSAPSTRLKVVAAVGVLMLILWAVWAARGRGNVQPALRLGIASSLAPLLPEVERVAGGRPVEVTFASSGRIVRQLSAGAPFDTVLLADDEAMDRLEAEDLVNPATRVNLAGNRLVLVAPAGGQRPRGLSDLAGLRVALGEPETVPLGRYAREALRNAAAPDPGRIVYGASAEQVLSYARSGEVDAAVVYATDLTRAGGTLRLVEEIDPGLHPPVRCPAAVARGSREPAAAAALLRALASPGSRPAFEAAGFLPPG